MSFDPNQQHRILLLDDNRSIHEDYLKVLGKQKTVLAGLEEAEAVLFGEETPRVRSRNSRLILPTKDRKGWP